MGHHYRQRLNTEQARKRRPEVSDTEDLLHSADPNAALSPNAIMQLQRTIGNQAVQRLIGGDVQHDDGNSTIRRDSARGGSRAQASLPPIVATITTERQGKIQGDSRIAGHEGKIEFQSLNHQGEKSNSLTLSLTKYADSSSEKFARAFREGENVKTAQFEFIRRNERGEVETERNMEFSDGMVANYTIGGGGDRPIDAIDIEFRTDAS
jgi:type VI protein secretion system component Hcp